MVLRFQTQSLLTSEMRKPRILDSSGTVVSENHERRIVKE
jgi:hypothetical protein